MSPGATPLLWALGGLGVSGFVSSRAGPLEPLGAVARRRLGVEPLETGIVTSQTLVERGGFSNWSPTHN
jgi:hypothetical protein